MGMSDIARHQLALEIAQMACDWRWGSLENLSPAAVVEIKRLCESHAKEIVAILAKTLHAEDA